MEEQGVSEERAYAICTASLDSDNIGIYFTDTSGAFKATIDEVTGFLTAPVKLARVGVQYYMGYELGLKDRALEKIAVFRSPEEVFNKDSVKGYTNLVVTNGHPSDLITTDNVKKLQRGTVSQVTPDEFVLSGVATVTDKDLIKDIQSGKREVSVGYTNDLKKESGEFDGVYYDYVQTNIRPNHLAIVDAGRCGAACKLTMDHEKEKSIMLKITIDGINFNVEDESLAQAIQKLIKTHDQEKEELEKKLEKSEKDQEELEKEKKEMEAKKDKAEAAKDALEKATLDEDAINKMVSDRAELVSTAKTILGDEMTECNDCPKEMKVAVINKVLGDSDMSDKSDDYIQATYDIAVAKFNKVNGKLDELNKEFQTKDKDTVTRETARKKYMKDNLGLEGDSE